MMSEVQLSNRFFMQQGLPNIFLTIFDGQQFAILENPIGIQNSGEMSPRMEIVEQPTKAFRFRYSSESGSHGSLMGESSTRKNRSFPKLIIRDCTGKVKLRAVLYHLDVNGNGNYIQHVHKLEGKNCNLGIYEIEQNITHETQIIEFSNVHIKHVAKRNVYTTLLERFNLELGDKKAAEIKAKPLSKILERNINEVKIGFHAEIFVPNRGIYVELCPPVYSQTINNRKTSNASDLKICRISKCSGMVTGGEEVFILCDKFDKKNIGVRFFQLDENNEEKWAAFGEFNESHVHHQVAIVFKTPPYEDQNIETEVNVSVQLYRPSDDSGGIPLTFTYIPSEVGNKRKKAKMLDCASPRRNLQDYKLHGDQRETLVGRRKGASNLTIDAKGGINRGACGASCTVTSSSAYAPDTAEVIEGLVQFPYQPVGKLSEISEIEEDLKQSTKSFLNPIPGDIVQSALNTADLDFNEDEPATENVLKGDADPLIYGPIVPGDFDENMFPSFGEEYQESQDVLMGPNDPYLNDARIDVEIDEFLRNSACDMLVSRGAVDDDDGFDNEIEADGPSASDPKRLEIESRIRSAGRRHPPLVYQLAVRVANSLLDYARSEDVKSILKPMADLIAYSDVNGDNAIHLAVIHAKLGALQVLLETMFWCTDSGRRDTVNAVNNLAQTPLHIAVCNGNVEFVKHLLLYGVDPNKRDKRGNTAMHLAVQSHPHDVAILKELVKQKGVNLDVTNNDGFTPLHLAVDGGSLESIAVLLEANATIDCQDGTAGRTPLHIAVQNVNIEFVRFLLDEKADPDMKMFNGRSPLHLAVLIQSEVMVSLLMLAYADPYMQSDELATSFDSSDDDLNVDETPVGNLDSSDGSYGLNCFDLAKDNERILAILHGNEPSPSVDSIAASDFGCKSEPGYDSGLSLPKYEEVLDEKRFPEQHDQDSGMGLCAGEEDDDSECGYPMGRRENVDSGLSLSKSEMTLVDAGTTISLSKLFDPPGEKDWTVLTTYVGRIELIDEIKKSASPTASLLTHMKNLDELEFGLEALGSKDGLEIIHRYKLNKDVCEKRSGLEKMMGKLKINH